jgi:uncharacterized protein (DUF934 family)
MALIKNGALTEDRYRRVPADGSLPAEGALLLSLEQWQQWRTELIERGARVGVRLASDQHPEALADDTDQLSLIALEFPSFRDGRAYSYARLLRDRFGYAGELRAVGDVLPDQLLYMQRVGFDAFEIDSDDPVAVYEDAVNEFGIVYQPAGDDRIPALRLRHARG